MSRTAHLRANKRRARKAADPMAMYKLLARVRPFDEDEAAEVATPTRIAFERLRTGAGTQDDFDHLATSANVCMIRAESIHQDCVQVAKAMQQALVDCKTRYVRIARFGFTGPELAAIAEGLDLYDQIVALSTPEQLTTAVRKQDARIAQGQTI